MMVMVMMVVMTVMMEEIHGENMVMGKILSKVAKTPQFWSNSWQRCDFDENDGSDDE